MSFKNFLSVFTDVVTATILVAAVWILFFGTASQANTEYPPCQPTDDPAVTPVVSHPLRDSQVGPVILYDEGHYNNHTITPNPATPHVGGTASALKRFLQADGYRVKINKSRFTPEALRGVSVLIIVEAAARRYVGVNLDTGKCERNVEGAAQPAFTPDEVKTVSRWVSEGGSLVVVYDHPPFAESAQILASEFGVDLHHPNGLFPVPSFSLDSGIVDPQHPIFRGRRAEERVSLLMNFNLSHHTVADGIALLRYQSPHSGRIDITLKGEAAFLRLANCKKGSQDATACSARDFVTVLRSQKVTPIGRAAALSEIRHRIQPSDPGGKVFFIGEGSKLTVQTLSGFIGGGLRDPVIAQFVLNLMRYAAGDLE